MRKKIFYLIVLILILATVWFVADFWRYLKEEDINSGPEIVMPAPTPVESSFATPTPLTTWKITEPNKYSFSFGYHPSDWYMYGSDGHWSIIPQAPEDILYVGNPSPKIDIYVASFKDSSDFKENECAGYSLSPSDKAFPCEDEYIGGVKFKKLVIRGTNEFGERELRDLATLRNGYFFNFVMYTNSDGSESGAELSKILQSLKIE